jgi:hypothetical protein
MSQRVEAIEAEQAVINQTLTAQIAQAKIDAKK